VYDRSEEIWSVWKWGALKMSGPLEKCARRFRMSESGEICGRMELSQLSVLSIVAVVYGVRV